MIHLHSRGSRFTRRRWITGIFALPLLFLTLAGGLAISVLTAPPAAAHASLIRTDPANGEVLQRSPSLIMLTFTEAVGATGDSIQVLDPQGNEVPVTVESVASMVHIMPTGELPEGTSLVVWRVVSADGHPITGSFSFSVGQPSAGTPAAPVESLSQGPVVTLAVVQGLTYLGLFTATGLAAVDLFLLRGLRGGVPRSRRRVSRAALIGAAVAVVGVWGALVLNLVVQAGGWEVVTSGHLWHQQALPEMVVVAVVTTVGVLLAAVMVGRNLEYARAAALAGVLAVVVALLAVGHTRTVGPAWLMVFADATHVLAGIVWVGGILGLVLLMAPGSDATPRQLAVATVRFSSVAAATVVVVGVAGVILGWRILGSVDALVTTAYGQTLLLKVGFVLVALGMAAYNRFVLLPSINDQPESWPLLVRSIRIEGAALVAVLLVTGFLTGQNPSGDAPASTTPSPSAAAGSAVTGGVQEFEQPLGTALLTARISPDQRGPNELELELRDASGAPVEPVSDPEVTLLLDRPDGLLGPLEFSASPTGPGTWRADLEIPLEGTWQVEVRVRLTKFESPTTTFEVPVG